MKLTGIILLCCVLLVKGQEDTTTNNTPISSDPTTTVSTPTTTKEAPTTSPVPPSTTTPSTTTAKPAPAPVPTPTPVTPEPYPKNEGKWSVEDGTNATCIILKGAMRIVIVNENKTETFVDVPRLALANGTCGETQSLVLTWNSTVPEKVNSLKLSFEMNSTTNGITVGKYALQNVEVAVYLNSSNATEARLNNIAVFQTPLNHSYSCLAEETLKSPNASLTLKIREVQLEAYRLSPSGHREFSTAVQCPADDATDVVPIAVGAALAGLVVIVLIAYLIGRKRSRARGYQSV